MPEFCYVNNTIRLISRFLESSRICSSLGFGACLYIDWSFQAAVDGCCRFSFTSEVYNRNWQKSMERSHRDGTELLSCFQPNDHKWRAGTLREDQPEQQCGTVCCQCADKKNAPVTFSVYFLAESRVESLHLLQQAVEMIRRLRVSTLCCGLCVLVTQLLHDGNVQIAKRSKILVGTVRNTFLDTSRAAKIIVAAWYISSLPGHFLSFSPQVFTMEPDGCGRALCGQAGDEGCE